MSHRSGNGTVCRFRGLVLAGLAALATGLLVGTPPAADAQDAPWRTGPLLGPAIAPVPFGPGELKTYDARLARLRVGEGYMMVGQPEYVRGRRTYPLTMTIQGGIPLARVDDRMDSWLDIHTLTSYRFIQDLNQLRSSRYRAFEFYPDEGRYLQEGVEGDQELPSPDPLDDVSFLYYVRSLPLEVGHVYVMNRYFRETGNPVVVEVLRKDQVTVPAGTFNTIVVRPVIQTSGLFGEGGEAEVHFSDDNRRLMVKMTSRVPIIGRLELHLKEVTYTRPLRAFDAASRTEAALRYLSENGGDDG